MTYVIRHSSSDNLLGRFLDPFVRFEMNLGASVDFSDSGPCLRRERKTSRSAIFNRVAFAATGRTSKRVDLISVYGGSAQEGARDRCFRVAVSVRSRKPKATAASAKMRIVR